MLFATLLAVIPTTTTVCDWVSVCDVVPSLNCADPLPESAEIDTVTGPVPAMDTK
jgi:hypothetical protein